MSAAKKTALITGSTSGIGLASPFKSACVAARHEIAGLTKTVALEVAPEGITGAIIPVDSGWTAR